ncbi:MAG TPA: YbfB/YjiJ family MFS transporter [Burkholderiaceae bacterium]|nr:YbfB/YjiJ family MFS transporter [Burkholderiaceae bacterium]
MRAASAGAIAGGGLLALAVAMGIGRFAFTPLLPVMQADVGLSVEAGGWLASANYAGYLAGALAATRLHVAPMRAILGGLLAIALTTLAMGCTHVFGAWVAWRAAAGIASAFVLVHVSAWSVERLAALEKPALGGVVFAGVGIGVAGAGLICLAFVALGTTSAQLWLILGAVSALALPALVPLLRSARDGSGTQAPGAIAAARTSLTRDEWRLILCYGAFGFGYIIPATFLPLMARETMPDPALFGWAWPLFGTAGTIATLLAARASRPGQVRVAWAIAHVVMAVGCGVAGLVHSFVAVLVAALAVGGTFMVITMYAVQEARIVAGAHARPLIGAMTAAFALGQIVGPLLVRSGAGAATSFAFPLLLSTALLLASGGALLLKRPHAGAGTLPMRNR